MRNRFLVLLLAAAILLGICPVNADAASNVPSGYTAVSTPEDLDAIRYNLSGKYFLTNDIDLTAALAKGGSLYDSKGWVALGYDTGGHKQFTGVIDGNGHTITGFKAGSNYATSGLVYENAGTIKNLTISGNVKSYGFNTSVFCLTNKGTIQNCHSQVTITTSSSLTYWATHYVGAIAGINLGKIEYCSNQGAIEGSGTNYGGSGDKELFVGGIAGQNSGTINASYNNAAVTGKTKTGIMVYTGGIAGCCDTNNNATYTLSMSDCYNSGKVTTTSTTSGSWSAGCGGLIGYVSAKMTLKCSYNAGTVSLSSQTPRHKGSLAGLGGGITFTNCYYKSGANIGAVNMTNKTGATALNESGMKTQSAFSGFDFTNLWKMGSYPYYYPVLRVKCTHTLAAVAAKEPGCETDGNVRYWYCSACNKYFLDSSRINEVSKADTIIPAAHSFGEYISDGNATCTEDGTKTAKCKNCDTADTLADTGSMTGHDYQNGVCTACGGEDPNYRNGDVDLDGDVDVDDVLALLWHVLFPDDYKIEVNADFDGNETVDVDDVLTLLWHVLFPDTYPLN